ncbi:MAG: hypothetical protein N2053_11150, partial [Chitinispirillaceae bacterium]|nr:hypothetical protein [Chitinispirillaceae bacterium]
MDKQKKGSSNNLPTGQKIEMEGTITKLKEPVDVSLKPPERKETPDQALWTAIRNRVNAISFKKYKEEIDKIFTTDKLSLRGVDAYNSLKAQTATFLLKNAALDFGDSKVMNSNITDTTIISKVMNSINITDKNIIDEESRRWGKEIDATVITSKLQTYLGGKNSLPYLYEIVNMLIKENWVIKNLLAPPENPGNNSDRQKAVEFFSQQIGEIEKKMAAPQMIELLWSYWHEEGLLVQTMNAISLRFQNIRTRKNDPLAQLALDPLRPLNNLLWGYIQDENNRLSILRRAYEYDHQYGITIYGKAIPKLYSADSRSKFMEAFHNLLYRTSIFYKEDADTTVVSDGFPLLNLLKELHLLLTEGQHNQFGDLPWTA